MHARVCECVRKECVYNYVQTYATDTNHKPKSRDTPAEQQEGVCVWGGKIVRA